MRTTIVGFLGGLAVISGAIVAGLNLRETSRQNRAVLELQRRGQVTERFSKAIEQLGQSDDGKLDVRIGAVYALEQIARDSVELHWPIMEVLTAHLREYRRPAPPAHGEALSATEGPQDVRLPAEAQAIATVIGRRQLSQDTATKRLDLHGVDLGRVRWEQAQLSFADLRGANLEGANLNYAQLEHAILSGANLEGADLFQAQLSFADLRRASLEGANLNYAQLDNAILYGTNLEGADLSLANLALAGMERAQLARANLTGASLYGAYVVGGDLAGANLDGANLTGVNLERADLDAVDLSQTVGLTWAELRTR